MIVLPEWFIALFPGDRAWVEVNWVILRKGGQVNRYPVESSTLVRMTPKPRPKDVHAKATR